MFKSQIGARSTLKFIAIKLSTDMRLMKLNPLNAFYDFLNVFYIN